MRTHSWTQSNKEYNCHGNWTCPYIHWHHLLKSCSAKLWVHTEEIVWLLTVQGSANYFSLCHSMIHELKILWLSKALVCSENFMKGLKETLITSLEICIKLNNLRTQMSFIYTYSLLSTSQNKLCLCQVKKLQQWNHRKCIITNHRNCTMDGLTAHREHKPAGWLHNLTIEIEWVALDVLNRFHNLLLPDTSNHILCLLNEEDYKSSTCISKYD